MKSLPSSKHLLLAAALALGLAGIVRAQNADAAVPTPGGTPPQGLIGTDYFHTSYSFINFDDTSVDAHGANFEFNRSVSDGVDTQFAYRGLRSESFAGGRVTEHAVDFGGRFYTRYLGLKPYAAAGIGWVWDKAPFGINDNSFTWYAAVGGEFSVTPALSLRPSITYRDATDYSGSGTWIYGVRANHWVSTRLGVSAAFDLDGDRNSFWSVGLNFRY